MPLKQPLKEHQLTSDELMISAQGSAEEVAGMIKNVLAPGELYKKQFLIGPDKDRMGTTVIRNYLEKLRSAGLEIGNGGSVFGYRMPLPEKSDYFRDLVIFRRRW